MRRCHAVHPRAVLDPFFQGNPEGHPGPSDGAAGSRTCAAAGTLPASEGAVPLADGAEASVGAIRSAFLFSAQRPGAGLPMHPLHNADVLTITLPPSVHDHEQGYDGREEPGEERVDDEGRLMTPDAADDFHLAGWFHDDRQDTEVSHHAGGLMLPGDAQMVTGGHGSVRELRAQRADPDTSGNNGHRADDDAHFGARGLMLAIAVPDPPESMYSPHVAELEAKEAPHRIKRRAIELIEEKEMFPEDAWRQARAEEEAHLRRVAPAAHGMTRLRVKHGHSGRGAGGAQGRELPVDRRFLIPKATEEELSARRHSPLFDEAEFKRLIAAGLPTGSAEKAKEEEHHVSHLTEEVPELDEATRRKMRDQMRELTGESDEDEEPEAFAGDDMAELWEEGLEGGGAGAPVLQQLRYRDVPVIPALSRHGHRHGNHSIESHLNDLHSPRFIAGVRGHHGGDHASMDHAPVEGEQYNPLGRGKVAGSFHSHNAGLQGQPHPHIDTAHVPEHGAHHHVGQSKRFASALGVRPHHEDPQEYVDDEEWHVEVAKRSDGPLTTAGSAFLHLYAGSLGRVTGPLATRLPTYLVVVEVEPHSSLRLPVPTAFDDVMLVVIGGSGRVGGGDPHKMDEADALERHEMDHHVDGPSFTREMRERKRNAQ